MKLTLVVENDSIDVPMWVAQCLEVDYIAQGNTREQALENFRIGFLATIEEHIKQYGDASHFFKPMRPVDVPDGWLGAEYGVTVYEIY